MSKIEFASINKYFIDDKEIVHSMLHDRLKTFGKKIIVLDDDPTGVQTIHGVNVYTDWSLESIKSGFSETDNSMFFILTNSRSFSTQRTIEVHREITQRIIEASKALNKEFIIIIRGDSTLRGHYPDETSTIAKTIEEVLGEKLDGEILIPFFLEGGRYTLNDTQYVLENDYLLEATETEFSKDKTFGYKNANLCKYIEEKTNSEFKALDVVTVSIEDLMQKNIDKISESLKSVNNFGKVIVNATSYRDLMVFSIALIDAINAGKTFVFRTAASFTKVIGDISDKALLKNADLIDKKNGNGGIIIVGSHMAKTTMQLEKLKSIDDIEFIEFDQHLVLKEGEIEKEVIRVSEKVNEAIKVKKAVAVYTKRDRVDLNTGNKEDELIISTKISNSLTSIVSNLLEAPSFVIAKGGITSSDVGVVSLKVKKTKVLGQVAPGVPVWLTGEESRFPYIPYIIFPGNVGIENTLSDVVKELIK